MQRTVYNMWGRQLKNREEANARAAKALADNPRIRNLHIAIIPYQHYYSFLKTTETRYRYQARWYDRAAAIKAGKSLKALRLQDAKRKPEPKHICNCKYCDYRD